MAKELTALELEVRVSKSQPPAFVFRGGLGGLGFRGLRVPAGPKP